MKPLDAPDIHHLRAAEGWLELGNHIEANAELENIVPALRSHPAVLELRWEIYAKESNWDACRDVAAAITKQAPSNVGGWIHFAYSTRRAAGGGLQAAHEILSSVADKFPEEPTVAYNLACYQSQLGNLPDAWKWLERAFDIGDPKHLKLLALDDKDLEPLWLDIAEI